MYVEQGPLVCLFVVVVSDGPGSLLHIRAEPVYRDDDGGTGTAGREDLYAFPLSYRTQTVSWLAVSMRVVNRQRAPRFI